MSHEYADGTLADRHARGEQSPTDSEIEIADLRAEVARLKDEDTRLFEALRDLEYRHSMCSDHIDEEITAAESACADIVHGFAVESPDSHERQLLLRVEQAIRDRK